MRYHELIDTLQNLTGNKPTQRELMRILGITAPTTMSGRASRNSQFTLEELKKIGNFYNVDLFNRVLKMSANKDTVQVDFYPDVFGSCGTGVFVPSENRQKINIQKFKEYKINNHYSVINAIGDSMQPFIYDNDRLIVEHYNGGQILDNKIYVFCIDDNIFVKRLILNINQLVIKSDNIEYETIKLNKDDINQVHIIGRIVGIMRDC